MKLPMLLWFVAIGALSGCGAAAASIDRDADGAAPASASDTAGASAQEEDGHALIANANQGSAGMSIANVAQHAGSAAMAHTTQNAASASVAGTGASSAPDAGTVTYELDLSHYSPSPVEGPLSISGITIVFPLSLTEPVRLLSYSMPGDLVLANTRVGCIDDPASAIGSVQLPSVAAGHLMRISITQLQRFGGDAAPQRLGELTCFSYRSNMGGWQRTIPASRITVDGNKAIVEVDLDARQVNAIAIFLPTYTNVSRISYSAVAE